MKRATWWSKSVSRVRVPAWEEQNAHISKKKNVYTKEDVRELTQDICPSQFPLGMIGVNLVFGDSRTWYFNNIFLVYVYEGYEFLDGHSYNIKERGTEVRHSEQTRSNQ
jgi:hypothetical protein